MEGREGGEEKRKDEENSSFLSVCFQLLNGSVTVSSKSLLKPQSEIWNHSSYNGELLQGSNRDSNGVIGSWIWYVHSQR